MFCKLCGYFCGGEVMGVVDEKMGDFICVTWSV